MIGNFQPRQSLRHRRRCGAVTGRRPATHQRHHRDQPAAPRWPPASAAPGLPARPNPGCSVPGLGSHRAATRSQLGPAGLALQLSLSAVQRWKSKVGEKVSTMIRLDIEKGAGRTQASPRGLLGVLARKSYRIFVRKYSYAHTLEMIGKLRVMYWDHVVDL
jgi:hypothetical protein